MEGAFAIILKSIHYPNELVAARKGSPLLIGVKTEKSLKADYVDVEEFASNQQISPLRPNASLFRSGHSHAFLSEDGKPQPIEFFLASDPSAIVEHTKKVVYLEDNDIAHIRNGGITRLSIQTYISIV